MTARSALDSDPLPGEPLASIRVTGGIVRALRGHVQLAAIVALLPIVLAEAAARRAVHGAARKGQATRPGPRHRYPASLG